MQGMRLSCIQMIVAIGDATRNCNAVCAAIRAEGAAHADLVVFPECALSGYVFETRVEAEQSAIRLGGPEIARIAEACRASQTTAAVGCLELSPDGRLFNSVVFVGPDGHLGSYRKTHLPHMGVDRFADRGDSLAPILTIAGTRVAALICYDGTFPEPARVLALQGAELLLLPTNWPNQEADKGSFLPQTRALENVIYVAAVNRVTTERSIEFRGNSSICDPSGTVLARGGTEACVLRAEIDPRIAREKRRDTVPGELWVDRFADRRPGLYGRIID